MKDFNDYLEGDFYCRSDILSMLKITPVTFNKWVQGSSICPPMPHEKVTPPNWSTYRLFIPKEAFHLWLKRHKPWITLDGESDHKNWRHYTVEAV
jgi:hypothetical protein